MEWLGVHFLCFSALLSVTYAISCISMNDEGLTLLKIKEKIVSDPFGALSSWRCDDDTTDDPCLWLGVECSNEGRIVVLDLRDLCLGGTLAPEIGKLSRLKSILLRNNHFSGIIPKTIGNLVELEVLDLGYNNFIGPLPNDLGNNLSLTILLVDNNKHIGNLSPLILKLQRISELQSDFFRQTNVEKVFNCLEIAAEDSHKRQLQQKLSSNSSPEPSSVSTPPLTSPEISPIRSPAPSPKASPERSPAPSPKASRARSPAPSPKASPARSPAPSPEASPAPSPAPLQEGPARSATKSASAVSKVLIGSAVGAACLVAVSMLTCHYAKKKASVKPWATGLSGPLQKAFVAGVPKLRRNEVEAACEDFSNVIGSTELGVMYKGTLSSGVEIAVASVSDTSLKNWSHAREALYRNKIESLSRVNHKNMVNLIGYCDEEKPVTRIMVFEYASNGTLFDHLHASESEELNWEARVRIVVGVAWCLEYMHRQSPPVAVSEVTSSTVLLTEDNAAKVSDFAYGKGATVEGNVRGFGMLMFEIVTGRRPGEWTTEEMAGDRKVDESLEGVEEDKLEGMWGLMRECVGEQPPSMGYVAAALTDITGIAPHLATPRLSPLWWAHLEIMSSPH